MPGPTERQDPGSKVLTKRRGRTAGSRGWSAWSGLLRERSATVRRVGPGHVHGRMQRPGRSAARGRSVGSTRRRVAGPAAQPAVQPRRVERLDGVDRDRFVVPRRAAPAYSTAARWRSSRARTRAPPAARPRGGRQQPLDCMRIDVQAGQRPVRQSPATAATFGRSPRPGPTFWPRRSLCFDTPTLGGAGPGGFRSMTPRIIASELEKANVPSG